MECESPSVQHQHQVEPTIKCQYGLSQDNLLQLIESFVQKPEIK